MTYQEALSKEKRWNKRALIISLFHKRKIVQHKKWNMRATAKRLGVSLGAVSEALRLAQGILLYPEIELLTRKEALVRLKNA